MGGDKMQYFCGRNIAMCQKDWTLTLEEQDANIII